MKVENGKIVEITETSYFTYIWIVAWMIFTAFRNMLKCSKKRVALF